PDRPLGSIAILSAHERATILREWNDTARPLPPATIPQLFAAQAATKPDTIAVIFEDESLSYGELEARANQLAHHLRGCGVRPEVVVGLCLERSLDLVVALLAILKAGGAYLPLDPSLPPERLAFMLTDAAARVLITQGELSARVLGGSAHTGKAEFLVRLVRLDAHADAIATKPLSAPALALQSQHPAYIIYTSGSTGAPKGVAIEHGSLVNHMQWMKADYPVDKNDIVLSRTDIGFDAAGWEIWLPLLSGRKLCIAP